MEERRLCTIRPGAMVCPGRVSFDLHLPGGGSPLHFVRPHKGSDGKPVPALMERTKELTLDQARQLRADGYLVDGWSDPVREAAEINPPAPARAKVPRRKPKE